MKGLIPVQGTGPYHLPNLKNTLHIVYLLQKEVLPTAVASGFSQINDRDFAEGRSFFNVFDKQFYDYRNDGKNHDQDLIITHQYHLLSPKSYGGNRLCRVGNTQINYTEIKGQ